jgi:hypothetical protein
MSVLMVAPPSGVDAARGGPKKLKKRLAIGRSADNLKSFWGEQKPVAAFVATGFNFLSLWILSLPRCIPLQATGCRPNIYR